MAAFPVTIFHNPRCSKSRAALELIRDRGIEPEIVLYRETGWTEDRLRGLLDRMGVGPRDILRTNASDAVLIAAMVAHPILVERPIVETPLGVVVGRPSEQVLTVLPGASAA